MAKGRSYYRLLDDLDMPERWYVGEPRDAFGEKWDPDLFTAATRVDIAGTLAFNLRRPGVALDFTLADLEVPVVSRRARALLERITGGDAQFIPSVIEGADGEYAIVNVLKRIPCLDEEASEFHKWTEKDDWPEQLGGYKQVFKLRVDPNAIIEGSAIFQILGWDVALIVSQDVKTAFEQAGLTGARFDPVTD